MALTLFEQFLVRAAAVDVAVLDDVELVGVLDGRKAVGDDDERLALHELCHGFLDDGFVFGVGVGGCFVQNDDGCVFHHRAGDGDALALATGEVGARAADNRVKPVFETHDKFVAAALARHLFDFGIRCRRPPEPNVLADRHIKEEIILRNVGDATVVFFERKVFDVDATDFDVAAVNIPKRGDKACNRRFTRTARAHECGKAPFGENHVDAMENLLLFFAFDSLMIAKAHIFQCDGIVGGFALVDRGARKFLHFEHRADFAENDARLADVVTVTHDGKERHHNAQMMTVIKSTAVMEPL